MAVLQHSEQSTAWVIKMLWKHFRCKKEACKSWRLGQVEGIQSCRDRVRKVKSKAESSKGFEG